ncbi:tripartite tricarboxylate transporter TctB family protein [Arvimicrobium flavum]|uniref:tripartite tricarboxylate transporter TctB family protein n=1 Tax=Arvimicrobium flavum TaxID=3393320 RepID=UPI00237C1B58|nr:tripartite tricarboxylate transporter TctB family protein [Mesorhizobium shangrilense]
MKVSDIILGPIIVAIGVIALIAASVQPKPIFGGGYGGGFFPSIIGVGLLGAGLILSWNGWRERAGVPFVAFDGWIRSPRHIANVAVVIGALLFYILASNWLGFIIAGFITLFATLLQFTRSPMRSLVVAAITTLAVKATFQDMLLVPLPWGLLEPYAGVLTWR